MKSVSLQEANKICPKGIIKLVSVVADVRYHLIVLVGLDLQSSPTDYPDLQYVAVGFLLAIQ